MSTVITHVAFDFDGTLADSRAAAFTIFNELAAKRGYGQLTMENLAALRDASMTDRFKLLGVPMQHLPGLVLEVGRRFRAAVSDIRIYDGIPDVLAAQRGLGRKVFIVSTNDEANIRAVLTASGLSNAVDGISCSPALFGKARVLRALMKKERITADQLVYVGDEARDIEACRESAVRAIAVLWGFDGPGALEASKPTCIVSTPAELTTELARIP